MEFIDVFFLNRSMYFITLQNFISKCWSSLLSRLTFLQTASNTSLQTCSSTEKSNKFRNCNFGYQPMNFNNREEDEDGIGEMCKEDIMTVMEKLGVPCNPEEELVCGGETIKGIFEEREISLDEVKEAFLVFDENRDGFIDASELQRVMCILRLRQGSELQACRLMIRAFDENGDGKIDFAEFVSFMEKWV
ncbi:hypothetical protein Ancab_034204 [Ancistrocladus abbreviatus]